ncbi:hypothetical protein [Rhizobium phage RHph_X3_9]|nr:hypothetical protein [Rhizobium phage RHph_X3_9]
MAERFYVDHLGNFIGTFLDEAPPIGGTEVQTRPVHAAQKWVNGAWTAPPKYYPPLSPVAFKLGMLTLNIVPEQIDAAIAQMAEPDRTIAKIYWTSAGVFLRDDPLIEQIAATFGKSAADIDAAWAYAETL